MRRAVVLIVALVGMAACTSRPALRSAGPPPTMATRSPVAGRTLPTPATVTSAATATTVPAVTSASDTAGASPDEGIGPASAEVVAAPEETSPLPDPADRLVALHDCEEVVATAKRSAAAMVGPYGWEGGNQVGLGGGPLASSASADAAAFSTTNDQEVGADEPDMVKTDGRHIFVLSMGLLSIIDAGPSPRVTGQLGLDDAQSAAGLLLAGDRVVVPGRDGRLMVVDVGDESAPRLVSTVTFGGAIVEARLVGGTARVVVADPPPAFPFTQPRDSSPEAFDESRRHNQRLIDESTTADWLPGFTRIDAGSGAAPPTGPLATCDRVTRPASFAGLGRVSVVTVDPADPTPRGGATVLADAGPVYASAHDLYLANTGVAEGGPITAIHQFDISDPDGAVYRASGVVAGVVSNAYAMSERDGDLRVTATVGDAGAALTVLRPTDGVLVPVGALADLGRGEQVFATRYLDDLAYIVTARRIDPLDPLFVVDLADPTHPAARGELEMPGVTTYLHPVGDHLLLGVGFGGDWRLQASLFDVTDLDHPARSAQLSFEGQSEATWDPHAFLWWAPAQLALLPRWDDSVGVRVGAASLDVAGQVAQTGPRRSLVIGDRLWTISDSSAVASDLATLQPSATVRLRPDDPPPPPPPSSEPPATEPPPTATTLLPPLLPR